MKRSGPFSLFTAGRIVVPCIAAAIAVFAITRGCSPRARTLSQAHPIADAGGLPQKTKSATPRATAPAQHAGPARRDSMGGSLRMEPGQTAVLSYLESEPGKTGLIRLTPRVTDDGHVEFTLSKTELTDDLINRNETIAPVLPDLFESGRLTAMDDASSLDVSAALEVAEGAETESYPRLLGRFDDPVSFRSIVTLGDGTILGGYELTVTARQIRDSEEIDVTVAFDHYTPSVDSE